MEQELRAVVLIGMVLFISFGLVSYMRRVRKWRRDVVADFKAALKSMQISTYELLAERTTAPSTHRPPEVYRILRDQQGRYFLYLHSGANPGIFHPLTEERALLAAKLNR